LAVDLLKNNNLKFFKIKVRHPRSDRRVERACRIAFKEGSAKQAIGLMGRAASGMLTRPSYLLTSLGGGRRA